MSLVIAETSSRLIGRGRWVVPGFRVGSMWSGQPCIFQAASSPRLRCAVTHLNLVGRYTTCATASFGGMSAVHRCSCWTTGGKDLGKERGDGFAGDKGPGADVNPRQLTGGYQLVHFRSGDIAQVSGYFGDGYQWWKMADVIYFRIFVRSRMRLRPSGFHDMSVDTTGARRNPIVFV